ncbi:Metallo-dependent phosphatase [Coprinellus micaceus]|uniref:Metallo-dependent phosphatase n=1 Tax=Coprinellus micaceus TaxID=71717 RepID=A0A4Y7TFK3_COPMI|nr:Metallo-dependent phosphatase [Coprinellus micaceus]
MSTADQPEKHFPDVDDPYVSISSADAVVHLEYTASTLPSLQEVAEGHGGGQWTRFVCISDTHTKTFDVPEGDVLLHSGDLTNTGTEKQMKTTMEWICGLPHEVKVVIAGNHDLSLHRDWYKDKQWKRWHDKKQVAGKKAKKAGVVYLENEKATFQVSPDRREWTVYGSPWSPEFYNWAFNYLRSEGEATVSQYQNADILLTHGPPHKIFDQTTQELEVGCENLAEHITRGRLRPRLHLFGHIHEAHGAHIHSWESPGPCEPLHVQNDINYPIELTESDDEDEVAHVEEVRAMTEKVRNQAEERNQNAELRRTVFVNGANESAGRTSWKGEKKVAHGGPGFRAVVVDLRD